MYNRFGLQFMDVVDAFTGAVSGDFSTAIDAQLSIENEIDMQMEELVSMLPIRALKLLGHVDYLKINCPAATFALPFIPVDNCNLRVYLTPDYDNKCNDGYADYAYFACSVVRPTTLCSTMEIPFTVTGADITITNLPNSSQAIYVSFDIDEDELVINSLKKLLRDMVCCTLGGKLYSDGMSEWKLVEKYCDNASKIKDLFTDSFIPSDFARLTYLNKIKPSIFGSVRTVRDS